MTTLANRFARSGSTRRRGLVPTSIAARRRLLILAEIDNFLELRRHLGCARAELLVDDVAERLLPLAPEARLSVAGRTLLELAVDGEPAQELPQLIAAMRAAVARPFELDGESHTINVLFGAAAGDGGEDDVHLIEEAEAALRDARVADGASLHDVTASHRRIVRELASELTRAIDRDELMMVYQPKVHVRHQAIESVEALVRWNHPERGLVLPGDFIPAAEEGQVIDRLTIWTLAKVIEDQRAMRARGYDLRIYLNIAGQLLSDQAFVEQACRLVVEADATIGFEVTETSVIRDPQSAIANLQSFADHGIQIAIDDYGAGLSSLAYLKQLPARELKIDKLFVTQLTSSNRDPLIVRSTIDLAHALEMEVVAEGVETHAALALLTVMGCDVVQGFLISRPIALDALLRFLDEDRLAPSLSDSRSVFPRLTGNWKRA